MKNTQLLTISVLTAPPANVGEPSIVTTTTSYALNSRVTEPNFTKFLHNVHKSLLINMLQSKLRFSNSFQKNLVKIIIIITSIFKVA